MFFMVRATVYNVNLDLCWIRRRCVYEVSDLNGSHRTYTMSKFGTPTDRRCTNLPGSLVAQQRRQDDPFG